MSTQVTTTIFVSYAREDETFCQELEKHLQTMQRQQLIEVWHGRNISAGTDWTQQMSEFLNTAEIILLLISPNFLASDYCYSIEMLRAMERHQAKEARVIPIILRPVSWEGAPFAALQPLPADGRPVTDWPSPDKAFLDVAENIRRVVRELLAIDEARSHIAAERYEQALAAYEQALQFDRRSAVAYAGKGDVLLHLGHFSKALDAYGQALQLDSTHAASESGRGAALLGLKRHEEALTAFNRAISLDPTLTTALSGKGDVLFQLHRYEEALNAYDKALRLNSDNTQLYVSRGYVLELLAQQSFEKAKQLGHSGEIHMEQADHSHTHMQSLPIKIEKLTLLQTLSNPKPRFTRVRMRGSNAPPLITALAMSPDGKFLAGPEDVWSSQGAALWDLEIGKVVRTIGAFQGEVSYLCFSSDGELLSSYRDEQDQHIAQAWDVMTDKPRQKFSIPSNFHRSVISADKQILAGLYFDQITAKWVMEAVNPTTGEKLYEFDTVTPHQRLWHDMVLAVSSDGKTLIGGSYIGVRTEYERGGVRTGGDLNIMTLSLWDASTGKLLHMMYDMLIPITALAISPDRRMFVSGYGNGTIKLWNLSTAQFLSAFVGHESAVNALTFSMDGHQVVSASADGTIKIWGNT